MDNHHLISNVAASHIRTFTETSFRWTPTFSRLTAASNLIRCIFLLPFGVFGSFLIVSVAKGSDVVSDASSDLSTPLVFSALIFSRFPLLHISLQVISRMFQSSKYPRCSSVLIYAAEKLSGGWGGGQKYLDTVFFFFLHFCYPSLPSHDGALTKCFLKST